MFLLSIFLFLKLCPTYLHVDVIMKGKFGKRIDIPVTEHIYGAMTDAELSKALEKEKQLAQQDRTMELTQEKKNALESYVYEMRNKVHY